MAFPTTGLLDNFNRATEDPLANGTWSGPVISGHGQLKVGSGGSANQAVPSAGGNSSSYWSAATFGPDCEVFTVLSQKPGDGLLIALYARIVNPNVAGATDGYRLLILTLAAADQWFISRIDNDVATTLGLLATQEIATGDSLGLEIVGSTITAYHKSAGVWSAVFSRTDATYTAAGNIAIFDNATTGLLDDFSGGTIVAAGGAAPPGHGALLSGIRNSVIQRV